MTAHNLTIPFEGETVTIEILADDHNIRYKVNFEHAIYLLKDVDNEGVEFWMEEGIGQTLRASELGEEIERHPNFI